MLIFLLSLAFAQSDRSLTGDTIAPDHPVAVACNAAFQLRKQYYRCIRSGVNRYDGAAEVTACGRLEDLEQRYLCMHRLDRRKFPVASVLDACVDRWGPGRKAYACYERSAEMEVDPTAAYQACARVPERAHASCVARVVRVDWDAGPTLDACMAAQFTDLRRCLGAGLRGSTSPAEAVPACRDAHDDEDRQIECISLAAGRTAAPGPAVRVCSALFEPKRRLNCLELVGKNPDPAGLSTCSTEEKPGTRLKCVAKMSR